MPGSAFARKLAATTVAAIACGGVAWASATMVPVHGGPQRSGAASETTVDPGSSTTTDTGVSTTTVDDSTTTTVEAGTTTTTGATTTSTEPVTTTTVLGPTSPAPCNHGEDVSRVAHTAPRGQDGPPGAHGAAVSAVAHEQCADAGDHDDDSTSAQAPEDHDLPSPSAPGRSHQPVKIRPGRSDS
jgi:hypothetical protein